MDDVKGKEEAMVMVLRVDRRTQRREELSCAEIMNFARKRGAKGRTMSEAVLVCEPKQEKARS